MSIEECIRAVSSNTRIYNATCIGNMFLLSYCVRYLLSVAFSQTHQLCVFGMFEPLCVCVCCTSTVVLVCVFVATSRLHQYHFPNPLTAIVALLYYLNCSYFTSEQAEMGNRSLEAKRKKRRLQKARRKKKISQCDKELHISGDPSCILEDQQTCSTDLENSTLSTACGEDFVAVEMRLEDSLKEKNDKYPYEYLHVGMPPKASCKSRPLQK